MPEQRRPDHWVLPQTLVAFGALLFVLWRMDGPHLDKEAQKYIGCAQQVLQGDLSDLLGNYLPYATYVLFLLPFVAVGLPALALPVQITLSIGAALALGRMTTRISGHERAGPLATGVFLLCLPVQIWSLALYTESLFTSLAILLLDQVLARERPGRWALPLAILVLFGRPVGLFFVGPLLVWWWGQRWSPVLRLAGYAAVLGVALLNPRVARPQVEIIVASDVLCGDCADPDAVKNFAGHSVVDTQVHLLNRHGSEAQARVWVKRMASLFNFTRPHYSEAHNLVLLPWFLIYPLALAGLIALRKNPNTELVIAIVIIYSLLVAFTCDEWSGRFLVPLLPLLIVPACAMLARLSPVRRG